MLATIQSKPTTRWNHDGIAEHPDRPCGLADYPIREQPFVAQNRWKRCRCPRVSANVMLIGSIAAFCRRLKRHKSRLAACAVTKDHGVWQGALGVIGVGTIGTAVVRGLLQNACGRDDDTTGMRRCILSPRGSANVASLMAEFPAVCSAAVDNQAVVDAADYILLSVLPRQAEDVLKTLRFRRGQRLVSLVSTLRLKHLQELSFPVTECAIAMPLPAVAHRKGAVVVVPGRPWVMTLFSDLGFCAVAEDENQFKTMQCMTALMGDQYKRQLTAQQWLTARGIPKAQAAELVGACFGAFVAESTDLEPSTLEELIEEQTPGGLNEQVWREQEAGGCYKALAASLSSVRNRLEGN